MLPDDAALPSIFLSLFAAIIAITPSYADFEMLPYSRCFRRDAAMMPCFSVLILRRRHT